MGIEENKALVHRIYDLINQREFEAYYELLSPECVLHTTQGDLTFERNKQFDAMAFTAFPDATVTIAKMVAEGDMVAFRVILRGTHKGEFMGTAPTGKKIEIANTHIFRIDSGRVAEGWCTSELPLLMQQIGGDFFAAIKA